MMKKITLIAAAVSLSVASSCAFAKISEEEAHKLGNELTPLGGEKAANADGSIPAWNGGITTLPEGYSEGDHHPDPFPGDTVKFTITADNYKEYAEFLSEGQQKLFEAYPETYEMPVYQSRRSASNPQEVYAATKKNAMQAELIEGGNGLKGAVLGVPFPVPEKIVNADLSLRLKGEYQYETIKLNQVQPSVFLTKPLSPIIFNDVNEIEAILTGNIERQIRFDFPYTVAYPGSSITAISKDGLFSMRSKKNSISNSTLMWVEAVHKYAPVKKGNHLSRVYQLQPYQQPLLNSINIAIRYPSKYKDRDKIHLYFYDQNEGWSFINTKNNTERQVLTGEIKQLDAVTIIEDIIPPIIKSIHPGNNGKYPSLELNEFKIKIDDLISGFDPSENSFELILDDQPLIFAYQPKLKTISYELEQPLLIGEHTLQFKVKDRAGNQASQKIKFKVY